MTTLSQKKGPIFIVGSARSGTTLLQRMLRSQPRISSPTGKSTLKYLLKQVKPLFFRSQYRKTIGKNGGG